MTCLWLAGGGCQREAVAQPAGDDARAPVDCFRIVDERNVASQTALGLCSGATTSAPGACYAAALDCCQLTSEQMLELCWGASSMEPLDCYQTLNARGDLTNSQIIDYCAATCPVGPPPAESSSARCVDVALDRTDLTDESAGELCRGSRSAGPAECFLAGQAIGKLSTSQLVGLCTTSWTCQYVPAVP